MTLQQCSIQYTYDLLLRTTLALQQLAYVRLAVRASNQIDTSLLAQRTVKTETSIYQPRPISGTRNDHPAASNDSTDLSFPPQLSSCIFRLNRQLSASNIQLYIHNSTYASYPHRTSSYAHLRLNHTSYRHYPSSWRSNTTATDFTHTLVIPKINRHFCCICYLVFVPFLARWMFVCYFFGKEMYSCACVIPSLIVVVNKRRMKK